jgi:hypothetical protein
VRLQEDFMTKKPKAPTSVVSLDGQDHPFALIAPLSDAAGHGSRVITAGDIFEAMNDALDAGKDPKSIEVGEVKPTLSRVALGAPPITETDRFGPPGSWPSLTFPEKDRLGPLLMAKDDDKKHRYLVEEIGPEGAVIVTSSEAFAGHLAKSLTICKCAGEPVHSFEPDQIRVPGVCSKPHGKPVTCSQASIA